MVQHPSITGLRVRSTSDANILFHAVYMRSLPMVTKRLGNEERGTVAPGSIYIWEERGVDAEATGLGIERWTDGFRWGPSRVRNDFLLYVEKDPDLEDELRNSRRRTQPYQFFSEHPGTNEFDDDDRMVKQTYSVYVCDQQSRASGSPRKWHLSKLVVILQTAVLIYQIPTNRECQYSLMSSAAYFTRRSVARLATVDDVPHLKDLQIPENLYKCARAAKHKRAGRDNGQESNPGVEDLGAAEFVFDARNMVAESVHIYTHGSRVAQDCRDSMASASSPNGPGSIERHGRTQPSPLSPSPPYEERSYTQSPPIEHSPIPHSPYPLYYSPSRHDDRPSQQPLDAYSLRPVSASQGHYTPGVSPSSISHPIIHYGSNQPPNSGLVGPRVTHLPSSTTDYPRLPPIQVLEQGIPSVWPINPRCTEDNKALSKLQYGW